MIQIERVISKLDEYYAKNDMNGAARHLEYWEAEAELCRDVKGQITVLSELAGLRRMQGEGEKALAAAGKALDLVYECGLDGNLSGATVLLNCATVYAAFGKAESAIPVFEKAGKVYEKTLDENDELFGGFYNNYAAGLKELGRYDEALALYEKALKIMESARDGQCEQAVTYLNMAAVIEARDGLWDGSELIDKYLNAAEKLICDGTLNRDVHYAFNCSKCAPVFRYYGWFVLADELENKAREIYAGN